jgi:hypothetical protein
LKKTRLQRKSIIVFIDFSALLCLC